MPVSLPLCICVCVSVTVSFVVYLPVSLHKANSRDRLCLLDIFFSSFYYSVLSPSCSSLLPHHPLYLQFHFFLYTFRPFSSYSDDRSLYLSFLSQFCFFFRSSIAPLPFWPYFLISATLCLLQVSLPHLSLSLSFFVITHSSAPLLLFPFHCCIIYQPTNATIPYPPILLLLLLLFPSYSSSINLCYVSK